MTLPTSFVGMMLVVTICVLSEVIAAPVKDTDIDMFVKAEAPEIARQWGLVPLFRIVEGSTMEMSQSGIVEVGRASLRSVLNKIDIEKHRSVIRWIIAHETWHQVQRRDFDSPQLNGQANRRLLECEADIMAAQYMVDAYLREGDGKATLADVQSLDGAMKSVIDELQAAEQNFGGTSGHPSGPQRRNAIMLGSIRGFIEHLSLITNAEERQVATVQMRRILDYKDDERIGDWASRTCQLIMHDGDGVADLTELPRQVDFNKNGDPPVVDFQLPYRNTGKSPISVVMQVMTLAVPRASPEDADSWQKVDALTYRFDLAPGQQYTLTGRLLWVANADAYPRLLFPLSKNSLYSAIRGESLSNYPESRNLTSTLPPRLSRLAANLMMIANAASDQFKSVRGQPCRNTQGNKVCPLTVSIPSSELAEITYEANGATSVEIILYDGKSANAAGKVYADFKKDLETIDPSKSYRERTTSSGGKSMSFVPTSTSAFELRLTKLSNGVFYVTATIVPAAYSD